MRVTITERHCSVPENVLARTESQVGGLEKFEQRATHAEVVYSDERRTHKAEVIVHVDGGGRVTAKGEGDDFRSALDQVVERLRRMLREQRERRRDHHATPRSESAAGE